MIGKQGIEKYYEDELKGIKGKKYLKKTGLIGLLGHLITH